MNLTSVLDSYHICLYLTRWNYKTDDESTPAVKMKRVNEKRNLIKIVEKRGEENVSRYRLYASILKILVKEATRKADMSRYNLVAADNIILCVQV